MMLIYIYDAIYMSVPSWACHTHQIYIYISDECGKPSLSYETNLS